MKQTISDCNPTAVVYRYFAVLDVGFATIRGAEYKADELQTVLPQAVAQWGPPASRGSFGVWSVVVAQQHGIRALSSALISMALEYDPSRLTASHSSQSLA